MITVLTNEQLNALQEYMRGWMQEYPAYFFVSGNMRNELRWLNHASKAYHLPTRKIRKCFMRKMHNRKHQEKRKYLGGYRGKRHC